jgi:transposase
MSLKLSDQEIRRRLQRGRNYERLYHELKVRFDELAAEHRECPKRLAELQSKLDNQAVQIAELQRMVFGRRKRPKTGTAAPALPAGAAAERDAASYRRPIPDETTVTSTEYCPVSSCAHCGGALKAVTEHVRYEEDIPLPELTPGYQSHLVTRYRVQRGVCGSCGRTTSGRDLGGAKVTLGPNVRLLATDLISRMGLSYSQVSGLLRGLSGLEVSDGELADILWKQHQAWLPAYGRLQADIRAAPVDHVDETPWPIAELQGAGYAWSLSDAASEAVCFTLENSRGASHATQLFGQDTATPFAGVRVSDDYGPYRSKELPGTQQLCWAHLFRTIRDLTGSDSLPKRQLPYVRQWYAGFAGVYQDLRGYLAEPYDRARRAGQAKELWRRIAALASQPAPSEGEPDKLRRLKAQLLRAGTDRLLVCLSADAPCDNNRAERDLRQLVLKRKRSFGSKTQQGAQALATVLSLCATLWRRAQKDGNPAGYFRSLATLAG